ncbi:MAG: hypothetical protein AAF750_16840 [Planctomycetota bacterium]
MARKPTVNLSLPESLLMEFNEVCRAYGHNKQKGQVLSAALMMFLQADPRDQGYWVQEVARADVENGVEELLERVRRQQGLQVATRDALEASAGVERGEAVGRIGGQTKPSPKPAKAAKKRSTGKKPIKKLPKRP